MTGAAPLLIGVFDVSAGEKASTNANRVEALLDFTLQCRSLTFALGQVRVYLRGIVQVVRDDLVDIGERYGGKSLGYSLSRRAGPESGNDCVERYPSSAHANRAVRVGKQGK
jgi:hypothetical protein